jgi:hypothetical protein
MGLGEDLHQYVPLLPSHDVPGEFTFGAGSLDESVPERLKLLKRTAVSITTGTNRMRAESLKEVLSKFGW